MVDGIITADEIQERFEDIMPPRDKTFERVSEQRREIIKDTPEFINGFRREKDSGSCRQGIEFTVRRKCPRENEVFLRYLRIADNPEVKERILREKETYTFKL